MLVQSELLAIFNDLLGQRARIRKGGIQATYHCPFCVDKNLVTQKLEIALAGPKIGNYHCWRCDTKGKSFGSLLNKLHASRHYRDAIFKLTGDIRISRSHTNDKSTFVALPDDFHPMSQPKASPEYKNALAYLKRRGILYEDILRYNIGYCENGEYEYHVIIPSYDIKGNLNFFVGRRYYETPGAIPHKKPDVSMNLVGFESFINYNEPLNLCEGAFDAIAIRNNAIPLFGKFPSVALLVNMNLYHVTQVNVVLDWDAEKDAISMVKKLTEKVPCLENVHLVKLNAKDPSKLGFEKTHEIIRNTPPFDWSDMLKYKLGL